MKKVVLLVGVMVLAGLHSFAVSAAEKETRQMKLMDVFQLALQQNLDIETTRFDPFNANLSIENEIAAYYPTFNISSSQTATDKNSGNFTGSRSYVVGLAQKLPYGGSLSFGETVSEAYGTGADHTYTGTGPVLSLTQPILQGFGWDRNMAQIEVSRINKKVSLYSLRSKIESTLSSVNDAYWNLKFATEDLEIQKNNLTLATQLSGRTMALFNEGKIAEIELAQTDAAVASREEAVLVAEKAYEDAQEALQKLLHLKFSFNIDPVEDPVFSPQPVSMEESLANALEKRPDYLQQVDNVKIAGINMMVAKNDKLPTLNLNAGLNLASDSQSAFGKAVSNASDNRGYSIGLSYSIPLPNTAKKNAYTSSRIAKEKTDIALDSLKETVELETREAVRRVRTAEKRVKVTKISRELIEKKLDAEEEKLIAGRSDHFTLLTFHNDLTNAKNAEQKAIADYQKAVIFLKKTEGTLLEHLGIEFSEDSQVKRIDN